MPPKTLATPSEVADQLVERLKKSKIPVVGLRNPRDRKSNGKNRDLSRYGS